MQINPNYQVDLNLLPACKPGSLRDRLDKDTPPEVVDLISKLLQYEPLSRITAEQALKHPLFKDINSPARKPSPKKSTAVVKSACKANAKAATISA